MVSKEGNKKEKTAAKRNNAEGVQGYRGLFLTLPITTDDLALTMSPRVPRRSSTHTLPPAPKWLDSEGIAQGTARPA